MTNPKQTDKSKLKSKDDRPTSWMSVNEFYAHFGKIGQNVKIKAPKTKDGTDATSDQRIFEGRDSSPIS